MFEEQSSVPDAMLPWRSTVIAFKQPRRQLVPLGPSSSTTPAASAEWREETALPSEFLARRARLFDLVVVDE